MTSQRSERRGAPSPDPSGPVRSSGPAGPDDASARLDTRGVVLLAAGSLAAALLLAWVGRLELVSALAVGLLAAAAAAYVALYSFHWFLIGAIVARPLLDLTAGPRQGGPGLTDMFGVVVLTACLAWLFVNREALIPRLMRPAPLAMGAFLAVLVLSTLGSPYPGASWPVSLRVMTGVVMFLVIDLALATRVMSLRAVVATLGAAAVVPLLYPFLGLAGFTVSHQKDGVTALKSVFFLSNNFAHFLVPVVVVAAAWVVMVRGQQRKAATLVLVVAGVELIMSQTRGAWLSVVLAVLLLGLLVSRKMLLAVVALVVFSVTFVPPVADRVASLGPDPTDPREESSLSWRFEQWGTLFPLTAESPLLGIGSDESVRLTGKQPHNDYLRALVESGVLGFAAFLTIWWAFFRSALLVLPRVARTPADYLTRRGRRLRATGAALPGDVRARATLVAMAVYVAGAALAATGENLIDNLTFLWAAFPVFAVLVWAAHAPAEELTLEKPERYRPTRRRPGADEPVDR